LHLKYLARPITSIAGFTTSASTALSGGNLHTSRDLVVITGASSGIGRGIARAFAAEGNPLLLISRHIEPLPELEGAPVRYAQADVADHAQVEAAIRAAARDFLAREIDVNLIGVLNCTKAVIVNMSRRRSGTIINISSVSGRKTAPVAVGYTASKYAMRAVSESLREAEGKNGVRVINVAPGHIKTNIHAAWAFPSGNTARRWAIPTS
jgi:NADP-dependent 3-hydroxy acid dehydrogenase YdfG